MALGALKWIAGAGFDFLNKRVDADMQTHIVDTQTIGAIAKDGLSGLAQADKINADIRAREGNFGPTIICMVVILAPFVWHEWLVVLDSCPYLIGWDVWHPTLVYHRPGSWGVPGIGKPGADGQSAWDKTEQAIFTSFFIGASTAVAAVAAIKAIKR
jgi:hypothetical protein